MTHTLKKQLKVVGLAAMLGGALLWHSGSGRAQSEGGPGESPLLQGVGPRAALPRDGAARSFAALLQYVLEPDTMRSPLLDAVSYRDMMSSISRRSFTQLGRQTETLLIAMARQARQPARAVRVQSQSAGGAVVIVEESAPVPLPFVMMEENGAWGVDLVETYAAWNQLKGSAKAEAIFRITQVELPGLQPSPEFRQQKANVIRSNCQSNLKQIGLGLSQYLQDWDERFPPARGWTARLEPYLKTRQIFNCPALRKGQKFGYAFNAKLSAKPVAALSSVSQTVSVYETSVLKADAFGNGENLAFRHDGGANYAFADGHVKGFARAKIPSFNLNP